MIGDDKSDISGGLCEKDCEVLFSFVILVIYFRPCQLFKMPHQHFVYHVCRDMERI